MAVVFKGFQSQIADKEGQKLFYPRVMLTGNVGTDLIAAEIAELSSLTKGDTKNVIDNLHPLLHPQVGRHGGYPVAGDRSQVHPLRQAGGWHHRAGH